MKVCKLSVCKEPTLYQSVHENVSESLLHSLFLHKTIQLSSFDLQSTARCPPFYQLVTSIAFTRRFATSVLLCYNFNGMIKWYDISCATLYMSNLLNTNLKKEESVLYGLMTQELRTFVVMQSVLRQVHSLSQSTQCDLMLRPSVPRILSFP